MKGLAGKLTEAALSALASTFICVIAFCSLFQVTAAWWPAHCLHAGPASFACHAAAFTNAWWWLAMFAAIPLVAVALFTRSSRRRA